MTIYRVQLDIEDNRRKIITTIPHSHENEFVRFSLSIEKSIMWNIGIYFAKFSTTHHENVSKFDVAVIVTVIIVDSKFKLALIRKY